MGFFSPKRRKNPVFLSSKVSFLPLVDFSSRDHQICSGLHHHSKEHKGPSIYFCRRYSSNAFYFLLYLFIFKRRKIFFCCFKFHIIMGFSFLSAIQSMVSKTSSLVSFFPLCFAIIMKLCFST